MPKMNKRWVINDRIPAHVDEALSNFPPFFRQVLFSRGILNTSAAAAYLEGRVESGQDDPFLLKDMRATVDRLKWAINHQEPIAVYGDYDVDGVTATALMTQVLRSLGAEVQSYIPNRFDEGYGLNIEALDHLHNQGVRLVLTVDCGIRSPREAEHAKNLDLDLIISDHHQPGEELPDAYAVVCPKQPGCEYPYKDLAGVGLAYKITQALMCVMPHDGFQAEDWLDLVAIGTVADVVPLTGENRSLVRQGLEIMRRSGLQNRPGLCSLANVARVKVQQFSAGDIAFMIGPRLNAAGRLNTAHASLNLLLCDQFDQAGLLSQELDNQNRERQEITRKMQEDALSAMGGRESDSILFAFNGSYNSGIVGLVASRLVETFYRPAVVGHIDGEVARASCRSIPEFHITQALDQCGDLLVRHGGHALAAGFTIRTENIPLLMERLGAIAHNSLGEQELRPILHVDHEIPLDLLTPERRMNFLGYLNKLQPTGQGNPDAVFISRDLEVANARCVGGEGQHLKLKVRAGRYDFDAIAFRQGYRAKTLPKRIDLLYNIELNEYMGTSSLQLNVKDLKPSGEPD